LGYTYASAQSNSDEALARLLSNEATRQGAVDRILEEGNNKIPLLLSWARNAPAQIDTSELYIGMAIVFGQLKVREAIPFLIKNINIQRWPSSPNVWMKTPQVVLQRLPAVAALIQIGPESSKQLIRSAWKRMAGEDRLAAIFVVSRIKGVPEADAFLSDALGLANMERYWAEEGIKVLNDSPSPAR
jgi:hypothetical protein